MKKLLSLAVMAVICLSILGGCASNAGPSIVLRSNWNKIEGSDTVAEIFEQLDYKISYNGTSSNNKSVAINDFNGTYSATLTNESVKVANDGSVTADSSAGSVQLYKLHTIQTVTSGNYKNLNTDEITDITGDTIETYVYFKGILNKLMPVESYRHYEGHSANINGEIVKYAYKIKTNYHDAKADVKVLEKSSNMSTADFTINKLGSGFYLDNEQAFFSLRAFDLKENFTTTIKSLSTLDKKVVSLKITSPQKDAFTDFNLSELNVTNNGLNTTNIKVKTIKTVIELSDKFAGKGTVAYIAVKSEGYESFNARVIKIETPLSFELGTFVYELTSYNTLKLE